MELALHIAEAKHRIRRRSFVGLLIALTGLAVGLTFAFRASAPGPGVTHPLSASVRAGELRVSVPRGFNRYRILGGIGLVHGHVPVSGYVLSDDSLPAEVGGIGALGLWGDPAGSGPPANGVALQLNVWTGTGPFAASERLHLPLTLNQPWSEQMNDGAVGYRYGGLRFRSADYQVMYWSGPHASAADRAAVLRALKSIRPARSRR